MRWVVGQVGMAGERVITDPARKISIWLVRERHKKQSLKQQSFLRIFFFFFVRWHIILGPDSHDCGPGSGGAGIC